MNKSRAQAVATRQNNATRKRFPLFADQIPLVTVDDVLAKREEHRRQGEIQRRKIREITDRHHGERIAKIRALTSDEEFAEIEATAKRCGFGVEVGWQIAELMLKRRAVPLTDDQAFVLALLCNQEQDVTVAELHRKCGDGMDEQTMLQILFDLQDRGYAGGGKLRCCSVTGLDRAPWEATLAGREVNALDEL